MTIGIKAPGYYVQGNGELDKLGKYVKKMGNSFLVLLSPNNKRRIGERIDKALNSANKSVFYAEFQGECSKKAIADAQDIAYQHGCDAIIGVGGGKALDTAKAVATNLGDLPTIIIPTIASNDAPCSSVAVIYICSAAAANTAFIRTGRCNIAACAEAAAYCAFVCSRNAADIISSIEIGINNADI